MLVQSVNLALQHELQTAGGTHTSGIVKTPVTGPVAVGKLGLAGDFIANKTVHGGLDQAVYLYSAEDNLWWAGQLHRAVAPGTFGENLTLENFDSRTCRIGDRLRIGAVLLEISAPRTPCATLAARMGDPGFSKIFFAAERPGAYARVLAEGPVSAGDAVQWLPAQGDYARTLEVFRQWPKKQKSRAVLEHALNSPIASIHKSKLEQWLKMAGE